MLSPKDNKRRKQNIVETLSATEGLHQSQDPVIILLPATSHLCSNSDTVSSPSCLWLAAPLGGSDISLTYSKGCGPFSCRPQHHCIQDRSSAGCAHSSVTKHKHSPSFPRVSCPPRHLWWLCGQNRGLGLFFLWQILASSRSNKHFPALLQTLPFTVMSELRE